MPDSAFNGDLSQILQQLLENPEISNLLSTLKSDTQKSISDTDTDASQSTESETHAETENAESEETAQQAVPSLSPEMLAKLPAVLSVLSGIGAGKSAADSGQQNEDDTAKPLPDTAGDDAHRKALLRALRPYLNPKRRSVVDSMLQLGDLTKLFGTGPRR